MNESMHKYFKPGIIHYMAYPETYEGKGAIEETIRRIPCDDYFSVIEVSWIKDPKVRRQVKKIVETSKMYLAYGAQKRLLDNSLNINDLMRRKG